MKIVDNIYKIIKTPQDLLLSVGAIAILIGGSWWGINHIKNKISKKAEDKVVTEFVDKATDTINKLEKEKKSDEETIRDMSDDTLDTILQLPANSTNTNSSVHNNLVRDKIGETISEIYDTTGQGKDSVTEFISPETFQRLCNAQNCQVYQSCVVEYMDNRGWTAACTP